MIRAIKKNPTLGEMWRAVEDVQYGASTLAKAIYDCACRDASTLPVGISGEQLYQAVFGLPGVFLTVGIGKDILTRYLKVVFHQYLSSNDHEVIDVGDLALYVADRWYACQLFPVDKRNGDDAIDIEPIDEFLETLINDGQPGQ